MYKTTKFSKSKTHDNDVDFILIKVVMYTKFHCTQTSLNLVDQFWYLKNLFFLNITTSIT